METVVLKNGVEEAESLVTVTMISLQTLMQENPIAFYELVTVCRSTEHRPFGNTADVLKARLLMEPDGRIHDSIRNIVLSAVTGEGLQMTLGSPI